MSENKRVLLFFTVLTGLHLTLNFVHPVTPALFTSLGFGDYMFGLAYALQFFTNFLFSPFWGKISGYISSRRVILIGSAGFGASQVLFILSQAEWQTLIARMCAGICCAAFLVSTLTYISNTAADAQKRGKYLVYAVAIKTIGGAFGYLFGGLLGEISIYAALGAQVVLMPVWGILLYLVCRDDRQPVQERQNARILLHSSNPFACFGSSRCFMTPLLLCLIVLCMTSELAFTAFDQSFNYFLREQLELSPGYNGVFKGVMGMAGLLVNSTLCVYIIKRKNKNRALVLLLLAGLLSMIGVSSAEGIILFVGASVVYFAIYTAGLPVMQDMVAEHGDVRQRNQLMGMYNAMCSLGRVFGGLLAGVLYTWNARMPFICACGFLLISAVLAAEYSRRNRKCAASSL